MVAAAAQEALRPRTRALVGGRGWGSRREPPPVKIVLALLAAAPGLLAEACGAIEAALGPIELRSEAEPWRWSEYYAAEMGSDLWRQFVALAALRPSIDLVA